jgi:hypothetical protein
LGLGSIIFWLARTRVDERSTDFIEQM